MFPLKNLARKGLKIKHQDCSPTNTARVICPIIFEENLNAIYCKTSSISHTKSQYLNVSHLVLQLSLYQSNEARC